jgi:hypothetical protein
MLVMWAGLAQAAPIVYVEGSACPESPINPYTRQYSVPQALRCMFEAGNDINPVGTDAEADAWLNTDAANTEGWGTAVPEDDWQGLGKTPAGFSFVGTEFNDEGQATAGTFSIDDPLFSLYDQFAIAVKDGGAPKFAIFMLPVGLTDGDWAFLSGGGSLSHFALYGRLDPTITTHGVPEPASALLLGLSFSALGLARRRSSKSKAA